MLLFPACLNAQGWPANYGGVMLQGFYWDSFVDTQWSNIESQADELSEFFDLVWVPQSGNCNTTYNVMGYTPVYYYDQNSSFGTESQLRSMISALGKRGVGVIADVVVNHRGSLGVGGSWVDFPAETHNGVTYQMGLADICRDDDGGATARLYNVTGAADTGEDWSGMRDLDHTSKNVQDNVIAYLRFLKDELGYAGFRYDMTKGYAAKYTGLYNSTVAPQFSVGEYWDGNATLLRNWVDGTMVDGKPQSATFDFATRYAIRDACNGGNWSKLSGIGLASYRDYRRYAVTFVENHDTQYRDASSPGDPVHSYVEAANAYILIPLAVSILARLFFHGNGDAILGYILLYSIPTAVVGCVWSGIYGGNGALSLTLLVIGTLLAPLSTPTTVLFRRESGCRREKTETSKKEYDTKQGTKR